MKKILIFILFALYSISCGTLAGHIVFYNFNASKYDVDAAFKEAINSSPYKLPQRLEYIHQADYFERIYINYTSNPEEMYQIGFTGDSTDWNKSSTCKLGLIGQFNGKTWLFERDLSRKEMERIENRFEQTILSRVNYSYYKSY